MSVICTNIVMRVVVVKVAVDRSRRIACRRFAGLRCRFDLPPLKKRRQFICLRVAISALAALSVPPFFTCKTMFVRPRIGRRQQHCPRLVRENARRVRRRRRGARRKSLQHLSVSARCRGRCCRRGGRESRCNICMYPPVAAAGVAGAARGESRCNICLYPPVAAAGVAGAARGESRWCTCLYSLIAAACV